MRKKYFVMGPFDYTESAPPEISPKGYNQSIEALARISEKAQPFATEKSMIIKVHFPEFDVKASMTAEHLVVDLKNAGYKESLASPYTEEFGEEFIKEKIKEAELYDGQNKTPVLCGFISNAVAGGIIFEDINV
jgi:hypothetical protein